ncbi:MAG: amino acid aminotransferase [Betaproteobacteria bacterium]
MFDHIPAYAGDPILSLNEDFQCDPRERKVNLTIGIYFDGDGRLPVLNAVRESESRMGGARGEGPRPYLPMAGIAQYREAVQALVFGADRPAVLEGRVATIQALGGGGALRVGGDFLKRAFPESEVWMSDPSWDNHRVVFEGCGFKVNTYPYYDATTGGLRFNDMMETIKRLPPRSIVLLHACCHNPTGVDLTNAQWLQLAPVLVERQLIPFVDIAYQGFGDGPDADAFSVRTLTDAGLPCFVANSFSKNFSLYGERCGGLSVVCKSREEAQRVLGQLNATVRANYSNPPTHGARAIAQVLHDPELKRAWFEELDGMRQRIARMRQVLHSRLAGRLSGPRLDVYLQQRGMFTYTGLSAEQADRLRVQHGIYILRSGRLCVAGLNDGNVDIVADAIAVVTAQDQA